MARPGTYIIRDFRSGSDYIVPDLIGLTIEQAGYEWTHRYGVRVVTDSRPHNADYRGQQHDITWQGFSGAVTVVPDGASGTVGSFTTTPAADSGEPIAASASVELLVSGTYNLVTAASDPLVTAGGDPLIVEI
jgi:hypothetical protein